MNTETALATTANNSLEFTAFGNISHFENAQRMAKALCSSSIVPTNYQGDANLGSCVIALEISNRIGASVLAVMQNLFIVHGKPGWSSQFLISCVNASRKFTPLRYKMTGEKGKDSWGCIAWAQDKTGEILESPEVTIEMAKAEGWYAKNGSKWKTMPELMLRYRTATLFARLYAPELTMGIQTTDELSDVIEVEATTVKSPKFEQIAMPSFPTPPKQTKPRAEQKTTTVVTKEKFEGIGEEATMVQTNVLPIPTAQVAQAAAQAEPSLEEMVDGTPSPIIAKLIAAIQSAKIDEDYAVALKKFLAFCSAKKLIQDGKDVSLENLLPSKVDKLIAQLPAMAEQIKGVAV